MPRVTIHKYYIKLEPLYIFSHLQASVRPFFTPPYCWARVSRLSLYNLQIFFFCQRHPKITRENTIGWHNFFFKCLTSYLAGIACPHGQNSRDALFYFVKFPASVNGFLRGQSRQGPPDGPAPQDEWLFISLHMSWLPQQQKLHMLISGSACSLSQPFSMSGASCRCFAECTARRTKSGRGGQLGACAAGAEVFLFSSKGFADCCNLLLNCWEQSGFGTV